MGGRRKRVRFFGQGRAPRPSGLLTLEPKAPGTGRKTQPLRSGKAPSYAEKKKCEEHWCPLRGEKGGSDGKPGRGKDSIKKRRSKKKKERDAAGLHERWGPFSGSSRRKNNLGKPMECF